MTTFPYLVPRSLSFSTSNPFVIRFSAIASGHATSFQFPATAAAATLGGTVWNKRLTAFGNKS
ncbi:hypothetical protein [Leptolyngbya iicbica]|uniref:Uncharacterized protein n=2 Tax=Cyanophyceae TaxID=3028117 RepID=A0A4Q7EIE4_9CYAN|nr:hypothetical protein [Leptolyngbya sp. LK]RZM82927.1 hypothetical protein DYY88_06945 [Leptolyngbya sp. LK]